MKRCEPIQYSDQTICKTCGLTWDTNDSDEPPCPFSPKRPEKVSLTFHQMAGCAILVCALGIGVLGFLFGEIEAVRTGFIVSAIAGLYFK